MEDIENIHRLLDDVDEELLRLRREKRQQIDVLEDTGELCLVVSEVVGWGAIYLEDVIKLGVNSTILNKFVKMRGRVQTRDAIAVAERIRSYLRSLDQKSNTSASSVRTTQSLPKTKTTEFRATNWVAIVHSSANKGKISAISTLLDSIIEQTKKANLPVDEQLLTEIERSQLIAVLETALNVLKSPYAEKGLMEKAKAELEKAAGSAAEKGVQSGLGKLAGLAAEKIADLITSIF